MKTVKGLKAFSREIDPGTVRFVVIAGNREFNAFELPVEGVSEESLQKIATCDVAGNACRVFVRIGAKRSSGRGTQDLMRGVGLEEALMLAFKAAKKNASFAAGQTQGLDTIVGILEKLASKEE